MLKTTQAKAAMMGAKTTIVLSILEIQLIIRIF